MEKRGIRRLMSGVLCTVIVLSCFIPAYGYKEERKSEFSWEIWSEDTTDFPWEGEFQLVDKNNVPVQEKDIFNVSCSVIEPSVVEEVYRETVNYSLSGSKVKYTVYGGKPNVDDTTKISRTIKAAFPATISEFYEGQLVEYKKVGNTAEDTQKYEYENQKGVKVYITKKRSEVGIYPEYLDAVFEGKTVRLYKKGLPTQDCSQEYEYIKYIYTYNHKIKIQYTYNEAPIITEIKQPSQNKHYNDKQNSIIAIEGNVNDKNIGDKLQIRYSIDKYNDNDESIQGEPLNSGILQADGKDLTFTGSIDIKKIPGFDKLDQNVAHTLYVWAVDSKNKRSPATNINSIPFYIDTKAPEAPKLVQDPTSITKEDVKVKITFPDDAVKKEYKIGPDGSWESYDSPIPISVNAEVYGRGTDAAGNSSENSITISNIDKEKPSQPIISANPENTKGEPITVSIKPGIDNRTSVCEVVYAVKNDATTPGDNEYVKYNGEFKLTEEGKYVIWAKTVDEAGNLSDAAQKSVSIIKPTPTPVPTSQPSSGGYNPPLNSPSNSPAVSQGATTTPVPVTPTKSEPVNTVPLAGGEYDLAVFLTSEKRAFGENEVISFTIHYKNNKNTDAVDTILKAEIPQYTTVTDTAGGVISGSQITWNLKTIKGNGEGKLVYKLKVGLLDKSEVNSSITASISASGKNLNASDDSSVYPFLLYSNRFGNNQHKKYAVGYKDNTFMPESKITRAEVAAMLTRVLNIPEGTPDSKVYADIPQKHWAYGYIYAATNNGLFEGYVDGSFKPDAYITRAELSTALARYLKLKNIPPAAFHFNDISKHWARNYIEEIYRLKLIEGYKDGTFIPDAPIKRVETVTIINRMLYRGPLNGAVIPFKDVKKDYWAYGHIAECSIDHYFTRNNDSVSSETLVNKEN
ncbi:MAG TPA: S-layer homology domain-containing protein [Pseudobacteroides sp.]|uniref:S-layer homology domain-containing protein n=1 Tax=Pseudobacteroides sp. TaxID=1968840 RepID=UPI002F94AB91